MSKTNSCEDHLLDLILNNVPWPGTIAAAGTVVKLYVSLHTSNPGEAATQSTNEISYTSYARIDVARDAGSPKWTVSGGSATPIAEVTLPKGTGGSGTATHFGVGTDLSGAGELLYYGAITPNIVCGNGITPILTTSTYIAED